MKKVFARSLKSDIKFTIFLSKNKKFPPGSSGGVMYLNEKKQHQKEDYVVIFVPLHEKNNKGDNKQFLKADSV